VYQGDVRMQFSAAAMYARAQTTANLTVGWHHIAGTYNGNQVILYVDGILRLLDIDTRGSGNPICTSTVTIGARDSGASDWYNGQIGWVRLHNRVLSADEVAWLAAEPYAGILAPGYKSYWYIPAGTSVPVFMQHYRRMRGG